MNDLIISLAGSTLKLSLNDKDGFKVHSQELAENVLKNGQILDKQLFAEVLLDTIKQLCKHPDKLNVMILSLPEETVLKFVTVNKRDGDVETQIIAEVQEKLKPDNIVLEDLYFSYQKIAPFAYQFIGIKKTDLEKYLEIASAVGLNLKAIISWVAVLPKYVNKNEPCIFIVKENHRQLVALSELNGVFFTGIYEKDKSPQDLQKLVYELSAYKRESPITRIYTVDYESFSLDPKYEISPLYIEGIEIEGMKGFEFHLLVESLIENNSDIVTTQLNLLNLLPIPVVATKNNALVYVGAGAACLILIGAIAGGIFYVQKTKAPGLQNQQSQLAINNGDATPQVLSETKETTQTTKSEETPKLTLNKADLKIKVENGAGVAGVAAKTRDTLKQLGYTVVDIGNAETNRLTTLLKFKKDKIVYKDLLVSDLKDKFSLIIEDTLDPSASYDVLMIVGEK